MPLRGSVLRAALAHRLSIRMSSTATGKAGRHYALGALLQRHPQDSSLVIYKAECDRPSAQSHLTSDTHTHATRLDPAARLLLSNAHARRITQSCYVLKTYYKAQADSECTRIATRKRIC
jgi:hypothetical protein